MSDENHPGAFGKGPQRSSRLATAAAIGSIALWCWSGVCFAAGSRAMGAMPYLAVSCAVGVATGVALHLARGRPVMELVRLPLRVIVAGFFGVALYTVALVMAVGMASDKDVGQVILINYLWPVCMVLIAMVLLEQKPRAWLAIAGALLGFGGVVMARGIETFTRSPSSLLPHAMALAGAFLWALYSVLLRRWNIPEEQGGSTFHFVVCALMAGAIATARGQWPSIHSLGPSTYVWIVFLGVGPIGMGYYFWEIGVKRGAVHLLALLAYFTPIGSAALVAVFFKEAVSPGLFPGAAMIAAGAWLGKLAARSPEQKQREAA